MTKFKQFLSILVVFSLANIISSIVVGLIKPITYTDRLVWFLMFEVGLCVFSAYVIFSAEKEIKQKEIYTYKDNQYIFKKLISVKNNETRERETFVLYSDSTGDNTYARNQEEFNEQFKRVI